MAMITLEYTPPTIVLAAQTEVFVTHVVDPSHFHVQLVESAGKLDSLMDELHVHCTNTDPQEEGLTALELGTPCLAQYSGDQGWYRVIITGLLANGLVEVSFVDYGNNEVVSHTKLRKMKPEFMELPIQAIQCGMNGIVAAQGFWSPEHIAQFEDLILEKSFVARFISLLECDSVCCVELTDKEGQSLNKLFGTTTGTSKTHARSGTPRGRDNLQVHAATNDAAVAPKAPNRRPLGSGQRERQSSSGSESSSSGHRGSSDQSKFRSDAPEFSDRRRKPDQNWRTSDTGDRQWDDSGGRRPFSQEPQSRRGKFNGHDDRLTMNYDETSDRPQQSGSSGNTWASGFGRSQQEPKPSGPTDMDNAYKCLSLSLGEVAEVYVAFVNNPHEFWIQLSRNTDQIDTIMEELNKIYSNTSPLERCLRTVKEGGICVAQYAEDGRWYRAVIKRKGADKCEVQFVDYGNSDSIPTSNLKELISDFLILPVQAVKCSLHLVGEAGTEWSVPAIARFEELTIDKPLTCKIIGPGLAGGTAVHLTDPATGVVVAEALLKEGLAEETTEATTRRRAEPQGRLPSEAPKIGDFTPQPITEGQKAEVVVSWMTTPEDFWCQLVSTQRDIMEVNQSLQTIYNKMGPSGLSSSNVKKGMPVIAKFSEDGCWYRGRIVEPGPSQVDVLFVDYGNVERVSLSSLQHPQEKSLKTPMLAVKCCLKDVKPASGKQWSEKTVGFLETVIGDEAVAVFHKKQGDGFLVDVVSAGKNAAQELVKVGLGKSPHDNATSAKDYPKTPLVSVNQELSVYVTSIENINRFWCQPSFAKEVDLEAAYSAPSETVTDPKVGTPCVTKFSGDGLWYRAEVLKVTGSDVLVRFIDYGNAETVKKVDLKCVKQEFFELPAQSFCCSLNGISDPENAKIKEKFNEITQEKEINAKVTRKEGDVFFLDMFEAGSSLTKVLLPLCSPPEPEYTATFLPVPNMTGQTAKAYISATVSLDEFYVQRADSQPDLDAMTKSLQAFDKEGQQLINPKVGQACGVKYIEDKAWYRGQITAVSGNKATVMFVDYGNSEEFAITDIKKILPGVLDVPPLAFPGKLAGTTPKGGKWSKEALELFEENVMDLELVCTFVTKNTLKVICPDGDVAEMLQKAGHAVSSDKAAMKQDEQSSSPHCKEYPAPQIPESKFQGYVSHVDESGIYIQPAVYTEELDKVTEDLQGMSVQLTKQPGMIDIAVGEACCTKYSVDNSWYRGVLMQRTGVEASVRFVDFGNSEIISTALLKPLPGQLSKPPLALHCLPKGKSSLTSEEVDDISKRTADLELTVQVVSRIFPISVELLNEDGSSVLPQSHSPSAETSPDQEPKSLPKGSVEPGSLPGYIVEVDRNGWVFVQRAGDEDKISHLTEKLQLFDGDFQAGKFQITNVETGMDCCARFSEDQAWYRAQILSIDGRQATVRFVDFGNKDTVQDVSELRAIPSELMTIPPFCIVFKTKETLTEVQVADAMEFADGKCFEFEMSATSEPFDLILKGSEGIQLMEKLGSSCLNVAAVPLSCPEPALVISVKAIPDTPIPEERVTGYVSSVEVSGLVYVQLAKDEDKLAILADKLQDMAVLMPSLTTVTQGAVCCAQFTEDGMWYRAIIEDCSCEDIRVRFVDYGNQDKFKSDSLKEVPEELLWQPRYAIGCKLKALPELDQKAVNALLEKTAEKTLRLEFCGKSKPYQVEIVTEDGEDIGVQIARIGETEPVHSNSFKKYAKQPLPSGEQQAFVTHVNSSGVFYVQLEKDSLKIDAITERLECPEERDKLPNNHEIPVGSVCCCKYSKDDCWYRAKVAKPPKNGSVEVHFVDFGNDSFVAEDELCELIENLCVDPPYGYGCKLPGPPLSAQEVQKLEEITDGQTLLVTFDSETEPYTVTVKNAEGELLLDLIQAPEEAIEISSATAPGTMDDGLPEPEKFKTLAYDVGSREEMYISHSESPGRFWCHPAAFEDQLAELMEQIAEYCAQLSASRSAVSWSPSQPCLAKFSQDEGWYRATVSAITENGIDVFFVDYGNTDVVPETDIVFIRPDQMVLPAQAVMCKLGGCEGSCSQDSIDRFTKVTADKKLLTEFISRENIDCDICYTVQVLDMGVDILTLISPAVEQSAVPESSSPEPSVSVPLPDPLPSLSQLTISESRTPTPLTDSLQVHASDSVGLLSVTTDGAEPSASSDGLVSPEMFTHIHLQEGSRIEVTVSHSEAPSQFWVQPKSHSAELTAMMDLLSATMTSAPADNCQCDLGQSCAALSAEDGEWYRGRITDIEPSLNLVDVCFVDYGHSESVAKENVRRLPPEFMAQPIQAVECGLSGIRFQGTTWTKEAKARFDELVLNKILVATILQVGEDNDCIIQLLDMGLCVAKTMIAEGFGVDTDTPIPTPPHLRRVFQDTPLKGKPVMEVPEPGVTDAEDGPIMRTSTPPGDNYSVGSIEVGVGEQRYVFVSHAVSPGDFWCHLLANLPELDRLMESIQSAGTQVYEEATQWEVGQVCLAQSTEDQQFYRAKIANITDTKAEVFYVDYGNSEEVSHSVLRPVDPKLLALPAQAVHCSLADVRPETGQWEETSCSRFEELTYQKELVASVTGQAKDMLMVSLSEGEDVINESLVQGGYAVPGSIDQPLVAENGQITVTSATPTEKGDKPDVDTALLGAVSQALKSLESTPYEDAPRTKPKTSDLPSPIAGSDHGDSCGPDLNDVTCHTIQLNLTRYNYLELDEGTELAVYVVNITDPGNFGVQPVASSADLENLMTAIVDHVTSNGPSAPVDQLEVGSPCLAQFSEDQTWYRGRVTAIDSNNYQVVFVDFGNSETLAVSAVRPLPETMLELPVQYIPCCLADIWPDRDTWQPDTTSFFKDMCDDKPLNARVSKTGGGCYHVYLFDEEDHTGWALNRYLLSQGVELIPGSDLEIEIELEDTMQPELGSSFNDMSMTKDSSIDECDDTNENDNEIEPIPDCKDPEENDNEIERIPDCKDPEESVEENKVDPNLENTEAKMPEEVATSEVRPESPGTGESDRAEVDQKGIAVAEKSSTEAEQAEQSEQSIDESGHWEDSKDSFG